MALRWGIAGVGNISQDFCNSLTVNFTNSAHLVVAIASRNGERSKKFAETNRIPVSYGNYEDLAKNDEVEIVYVANLNNLHHETCLLMLNYGKHILCEKPFCMNYLQAKQVVDLAKTKNLFIMEGVWSRFFPVYTHLREILSNKELVVKEIYVKHGFKGDTVDRVAKKDLGGGIILDIGVYAIQFVLFVFGCEEQPRSVKANGTLNEDGVDMFFNAQLEFSNNRSAKIICSGFEELENQATVVTNKGVISIPTYWCPTQLTDLEGTIRSWPLPDAAISMNFTNSLGLRYEADKVQQCIRSGQLFCDVIPPNESLLIAQIQDEIRRQIGIFDKKN